MSSSAVPRSEGDPGVPDLKAKLAIPGDGRFEHSFNEDLV